MITEITSPPFPADTLERIDEIDAGAAVQARIAPAVVDVLVAVHPCVARVADTLAIVTFTPATAWRTLGPAVQTIVRQAELRIVCSGFRAVLALPVGRTVTVVIRLRVEALGVVAARIRTAMVAIDLALGASVSHGTDALVGVYEVTTLAAVLAGFRGALVDVDLAVLARVARRAGTVVVVDEVDAQRVVLALTHAVVDVARAVLPDEAAATLTPVETNKGILVPDFFV